jgi:hypothetical protein
LAIARPWLDSIRQSLSGKKIFILGPIADGDLTDACSLRSLETLLSPLPTQLVNVNDGSQSIVSFLSLTISSMASEIQSGYANICDSLSLRSLPKHRLSFPVP